MNTAVLHWEFIARALSIVLINLVLSGDNAVVIALAVRQFPKALRIRAMAVGAAVAVCVLIGATLCAAWLLHIRFLQLAGGIFILWIAISIFRQPDSPEKVGTAPPRFWRAMWFVVLADVTMSTDNILAVAAAARENWSLMVLGLAFSIPCVIFASAFLVRLMDKYPFLLYLGAAILGQVGSEMIITDPVLVSVLQPGAVLRYSIEAAGAASVLLISLWISRSNAVVSETCKRAS